MKRLSLGIDISKADFHVCLSSIDFHQKVTVLRSGTFPNTKAGFEALHKWLRDEQRKAPGLPLSITLEATGVYYECCALYLHQKGYSLSVVLPNKAKKYISALGIKTKNDKADAKALSRMGAEQCLSVWQPMAEYYYMLRELTRFHQQLQENKTVLTNQLHAAEGGMYQQGDVIKGTKKLIEALDKQIEATLKKIAEHLRSQAAIWIKAQQLISIPGVGELTAAVIMAETNGFALFTSAAQLVSYAGYDVVENQSGGQAGKTRISKKGNARIRRILHMPAFTAVRHKVEVCRRLYERTYCRHGQKMKSYVAVQKKLLALMYTLWKKNVSFDKNYYTQKHTSTEEEAVRSSGLQPKAETGRLAVAEAA